MNESNVRSIIKTITWRLTGSGATLLISYLISHNFAMSSTIALTQLLANTVLYYVHERIWNRFRWGKS